MNQNDLNDSLCEFAGHGILFGVKRCLGLGSDAETGASEALRWAARCGHWEVVKVIENYTRSGGGK